MPEKNNNRKKPLRSKESLNSYAKYSGIAFQMIFIILAGVYGGIKLDDWLKTKKPVFTALVSVMAVMLAIFLTIKDLIKPRDTDDKRN